MSNVRKFVFATFGLLFAVGFSNIFFGEGFDFNALEAEEVWFIIATFFSGCIAITFMLHNLRDGSYE